MVLCRQCNSIKYDSLIASCLAQCIARQDAGIVKRQGEPLFKHHLDIFQVENSSQSCDLCRLIFTASQDIQVRVEADRECARDVPIVFRVDSQSLEVCYDLGPDEKFQRYVKICGIDVSMRTDDVDRVFQEFGIRVDDQPPILRKLESYPSSTSCFDISARWLEDCVKNHNACTPNGELQKPPKRLLNVGSELTAPFLVETISTSSRYEWISLSYCWGTDPCLKLTEASMQSLQNGISMEKLDATIRDAILVTRALKVPYLWVDALCIIQNQQATEWKQEASRMNEIYGGSLFTLVVASSHAVSDGFLKYREQQYVSLFESATPLKLGTTVTGVGTEVFLSRESNRKGDHEDGPWSDRGWTMQEGLLPNRLLYFTSSQIIWQCCQTQSFETGLTRTLSDSMDREIHLEGSLDFGSQWFYDLDPFTQFKAFPRYLPSNPDFDILSQPITFELWYILVEDFTMRRFAHITDRLAAIAGLARIYGRTIRCKEYIAGLWGPDLVRGLMWQRADERFLSSQESVQGTSSIFPSWSWACVDYERLRFPRRDRPSLAHIEHVQHFTFDDAKDAYVTLSGPVKLLTKLYVEGWECAETQMTELERHLSKIISGECGAGIPKRYCLPQGGSFAIIQMLGGSDLGLLVLEHTGRNRHGLCVYKRVGVQILHFIHRQNIASPSLLNFCREYEKSPSKLLRPQPGNGRTVKGFNKIVEEIRRENWQKQTIMII